MMFDPTLGWLYREARSHLVLGVTPAHPNSDNDLTQLVLFTWTLIKMLITIHRYNVIYVYLQSNGIMYTASSEYID